MIFGEGCADVAAGTWHNGRQWPPFGPTTWVDVHHKRHRAKAPRRLVSKHRFDKARRRVHLLRQLHQPGCNGGKIFMAGIIPSTTFGADAVRPRASDIAFFRTQALKEGHMHLTGVPPDITYGLWQRGRPPCGHLVGPPGEVSPGGLGPHHRTTSQ